MKRLFVTLCIAAALLLGSTGCGGRRMRIPDYIDVKSPVLKVPSAVTRRAVERACRRRGWQTKRRGRKSLMASYGRGRLFAAVVISWRRNTYSIRYYDSRGFRYDERSASIHGRYGRWLDNLRRAIHEELQELAPGRRYSRRRRR